jgi:hypothetical protein
MSDIREEIVKKAEQNMKRKRQKEVYKKIEKSVRKKIELENKEKDKPNSPIHMPKMLFVLICTNVILFSVLWILVLLESGDTDQIKYALIAPLFFIPTIIIAMYIRYLIIYIYSQIYWWVTTILWLLITLVLTYLVIATLFGNTILTSRISL